MSRAPYPVHGAWCPIEYSPMEKGARILIGFARDVTESPIVAGCTGYPELLVKKLDKKHLAKQD